jgi:uncharacterized protein
LAAMALVQMASYEGEMSWIEIAKKAFFVVMGSLVEYPLFYGKWLCAINIFLSPVIELALLFPPNYKNVRLYDSVLWSTHRPDCIVAATTYPPEQRSPKLLHNRSLVNDQPTVYICRNFTCDLPIQTPEQLREKLI